MWKPAALVALSLALEGAFILNAVVPDPRAMRRAAVEARVRSPEAAVAGSAAGAISPGAVAAAR
jgi:hypothetical protein